MQARWKGLCQNFWNEMQRKKYKMQYRNGIWSIQCRLFILNGLHLQNGLTNQSLPMMMERCGRNRHRICIFVRWSASGGASETMVIEDSPSGVKAAVAANAACIVGIYGDSDKKLLQNTGVCDYLIEDYTRNYIGYIERNLLE